MRPFEITILTICAVLTLWLCMRDIERPDETRATKIIEQTEWCKRFGFKAMLVKQGKTTVGAVCASKKKG